MPILSAEMVAGGILPGGEGGQWFRDLVISRSDPNFFILAMDVGRLYRTQDGGADWEPCNVGWNARGCSAVSIDPTNADRVLGVSGNSMDWQEGWGRSPNGLCLSIDRAASWRHVLPRLEASGAAYNATGGAVAFDPSPFDRDAGHCRRALFIPREGGVFRSEDGGNSRAQIADGMGPSRIEIAGDGTVYLSVQSARCGCFIANSAPH